MSIFSLRSRICCNYRRTIPATTTFFGMMMDRFWQHGIGTSLMRVPDRNRKVIVDQPQPGRELVTVVKNDLKFVFDVEWSSCSVYNRSLLHMTPLQSTSCWLPKHIHEAQDALAW